MAGLLRTVAVVTSGLILVGFGAFASDQAERGSARQVEAVDAGDAGDAERKRESRSGPVREAVDDANDVLLAPFDGVTDSDDVWLAHTIPAALGLLSYGLGLMLLANYLPKPRRRGRDWRTA